MYQCVHAAGSMRLFCLTRLLVTVKYNFLFQLCYYDFSYKLKRHLFVNKVTSTIRLGNEPNQSAACRTFLLLFLTIYWLTVSSWQDKTRLATKWNSLFLICENLAMINLILILPVVPEVGWISDSDWMRRAGLTRTYLFLRCIGNPTNQSNRARSWLDAKLSNHMPRQFCLHTSTLHLICT